MDRRAEGTDREAWPGSGGVESVGGSVEYVDGSVPRVDGSVLRVDGAELRAAGAACLAAAQAFAQVAAAVVAARGATGLVAPAPGLIAASGSDASQPAAAPGARRALGEAVSLWERACTHLGALFGDLGERLEGIDVAFGEVDEALAGSLARLGR